VIAILPEDQDTTSVGSEDTLHEGRTHGAQMFVLM